jgi:hypothetical protein
MENAMQINDLIDEQMDMGSVTIRETESGDRVLKFDPASYSMAVIYGDGTAVTIHPRAIVSFADAIRERTTTQ